MNLYQYCGNNPTNYVDPWGLVGLTDFFNFLNNVGSPGLPLPNPIPPDLSLALEDFLKKQSDDNTRTEEEECKKRKIYYHYGYMEDASSISLGLWPGTYGTPTKYDLGNQAQDELSLPQHRPDDAPPDAYWEVYPDRDTPVTDPYTVPPTTTPDRGGGGLQVRFPKGVSADNIRGPFHLDR